MKLGLGTVQFGLDYGISNNKGKVSVNEVRNILRIAEEQGIRVLDTAALYGESEKVLGQVLGKKHPFHVVTKTPKFINKQIGTSDIRLLDEIFGQSLLNLKQESIYGLLLHQADDLFKENGSLLLDRMYEYKRDGWVRKIGISVYDGNQIDQALNCHSFDLIQIPINVFDQRLIKSGHLKRLKDMGVEIHARSVFLQGLLLMDPSELPPYFNGVKNMLINYRQELCRKGISPVGAALNFVKQLHEIDVILCGVNDMIQFREIIEEYHKVVEDFDFSKFTISNQRILNPALWEIN